MCSEYSRESARGTHPSRPRPPRGCRGAERPTPASSETKAVRRTACPVGNEYLHQNSSGRAREGHSPLAPVTRGGVGERSVPRSCRQKQRPQKNSLHRREPKPRQNSPGRAREGRSPLAPRRPPHQKRASPAKRPSDSSPSLYQPCGKDASNPDTNRAYPRAFHVRPPPYPTFSTIYPQPPVWKILKNCRFTLE